MDSMNIETQGETHILKDKVVKLAYRTYFECPVVHK